MDGYDSANTLTRRRALALGGGLVVGGLIAANGAANAAPPMRTNWVPMGGSSPAGPAGPRAGFVLSPSVGTNADGRLEVFAGSTSELRHCWQIAQNGTSGWSGWASLGSPPNKHFFTANHPVVGTNADGRLEVFARADNYAVWHCWQLPNGAGWSGWASLGGETGGVPARAGTTWPPFDPRRGVYYNLAVARNVDGRLEVFGQRNDLAVWHCWQLPNGAGWSGWASLGGYTLGPINVGTNQDGRLEVFAAWQDDGVLWHCWQLPNGAGWSGWASLGGGTIPPCSPPVAQNADGRLEVFMRGGDHTIKHRWQIAQNGTSGWSGWESLGGPQPLIGISTNDFYPQVARNADGRLEVFAVGGDDSLWHCWQIAPNGTSGWSGWESLGGSLASGGPGLTVVTLAVPGTPPLGRPVGTNQDGRLEVFSYADLDGGMWHRWQTANGWNTR